MKQRDNVQIEVIHKDAATSCVKCNQSEGVLS